MKRTNLKPYLHRIPAGVLDLVTPVGIYLKIRDAFPNAILLESSDYHGNRNRMSYICFDIMGGFRVSNGNIRITFPGGEAEEKIIDGPGVLAESWTPS